MGFTVWQDTSSKCNKGELGACSVWGAGRRKLVGGADRGGATESFTEAETCQARRGKAEATSMDSASGEELTSVMC